MKVYLCGEKGCCPFVEKKDGEVQIGEGGNMCTLSINEFDTLKNKIIKGEL